MNRELFLEGFVDSYFFTVLIQGVDDLKNLNIKITPKKGVNNIMNSIKPTSVDVMRRLNNIDKLGIVADADYFIPNSTGGDNDGSFDKRWQKFSTLLSDNGFNCARPNNPNEGSIFINPNRVNSKIGLWLMPNHFNDGSLEDLILQTIALNQPVTNTKKSNITQEDLIIEARKSIVSLHKNGFKTFKYHHNSKAKAFTWLAWQKKPRHFIGEVINKDKPQDSLIDLNSPEIQGLVNWLKQVFI